MWHREFAVTTAGCRRPAGVRCIVSDISPRKTQHIARRCAIPDLSQADVEAMANALGFPLTAEDVVEITHRLNAFMEALAPLASLPLNEIEPLPMLPEHHA